MSNTAPKKSNIGLQMELTPAQTRSLQTLTINSSSKTRSFELTAGQQVSAKVLAVNTTTKEITLSINNVSLKAQSILPLRVGQSLELAVIQSGKEIVLQVRRDNVERTITQQTLRESLPKQQALDETLKNLEQVVKEGKNSGISDKVVQLIQRFIQQIPGAQQLSQASGLKDAILKSGVFLENTLANLVTKNTSNKPHEKISLDFKYFLIQLKSLLFDDRKNTIKQPSLEKPSGNPEQRPVDKKLLDIAKQIKNSEEAKHLTAKEQTQNTNLQVKNALQQALLKITQQQKSISQNLSRLLNTSTTSITLPSQQIGQPNLLNPSVVRENIAQPSLKDALAFTSGAQKSNKPEINFSRLVNLTDLLDTLIKQVDAGISRTQLHQLNSVLETDSGKLNWSMEIPVKIDEKLHSVHFHLEKEPGADEDADPVLTVNIALDLEYLGPVYARITLISENVGVVIWAEREETHRLTQDHVEDLQNNLSKSGFKPENISFHQGQPPHNPVMQKTQKSALLDITV